MYVLILCLTTYVCFRLSKGLRYTSQVTYANLPNPKNFIADTCELLHSYIRSCGTSVLCPRTIHTLSTECLWSVCTMSEDYLQPKHEAICGFCETYVLEQRGRHPMIPNSRSLFVMLTIHTYIRIVAAESFTN